MNIDGEYIISKICERLRFENILYYDSAIVNKLRELNKYEVMQLLSLGDIDKWHNDAINRSPKE